MKAKPITLYNTLQLSKLSGASRRTIEQRYQSGLITAAAIDAAGKPLFTGDAASKIHNRDASL